MITRRQATTAAAIAVACMVGAAVLVLPAILRSASAPAQTEPASHSQPHLGPVHADCPTGPSSPPAGADARSTTEEAAMPDDRFWQLIDQVGTADVDERVAALSSQLSTCSVESLVAFDARLTLVLYDLDTRRACLWRLSHDDGFAMETTDDFLYERADTVLAGRANYRKALADGTLPWGSVDPGDGEALLYIAETAAESAGHEKSFERLRQQSILLSYESGSNPRSTRPDDIQIACEIGD